MSSTNGKPSTKARREGYAQLFKLKLFLHNLLGIEQDSELWKDDAKPTGWRDFMVKYMPPEKRGGPEKVSRKRKSKLKDRKSTIR
jgi:hypothetical protein